MSWAREEKWSRNLLSLLMEKEDSSQLFLLSSRDGGSNGFKLQQGTLKLNFRKKFQTGSAVNTGMDYQGRYRISVIGNF